VLARELADRHAPLLARLGPVAGEAVEHDPVGLDAHHRPLIDHQGSGILNA
jgi:hypothetical protein